MRTVKPETNQEDPGFGDHAFWTLGQNANDINPSDYYSDDENVTRTQPPVVQDFNQSIMDVMGYGGLVRAINHDCGNYLRSFRRFFFG